MLRFTKMNGAGNDFVMIDNRAGDLQLGVANTGFTGAPTVSGGILEVQNTQALGTTAPTITVGGTGEVVMTNLTWTGPIVANTGGAISGNSGNSIYSGAITASGNFNARAREIYGIYGTHVRTMVADETRTEVVIF